jgi:maltoporin
VHELAAGQRQGTTAGAYDTLPADSGWVIGGELGAFTGKRNTHVDLFVRYATGLAAYGEWGTPTDLAQGGTTQGAHEFLAALGGNYEFGPVGLMIGAYLRSFRNASPTLNFDDVDEGIVAVRPHLFIGNIGGVALEGSYQAQVRGTIAQNPDGSLGTGPLVARLFRFGVIPFLSPAGRGDYSRPQFRLIYSVSVRDQGAQSLYPHDDVFSLRNVEHFFGFGAEWWFNSSSYGG